MPAGQQRQYARWLAAETYRNWTGPWYHAYHYCRAGLPPEWPVRPLLPTDSYQPMGVALLYDERIGPRNFQHLFTLLRDRVVAQGYRVAHSDERHLAGHTPDEIIAKYVLHPLPTDSECRSLCDQRFGQVTLDLVRRERQPLLLRLIATPLLDPIFTKAPPFDELLKLILGCDA